MSRRPRPASQTVKPNVGSKNCRSSRPRRSTRISDENPTRQLVSDDWLSGTYELSLDERGAYVTIVSMIYARGGPITMTADWPRLTSTLVVEFLSRSAVSGCGGV